MSKVCWPPPSAAVSGFQLPLADAADYDGKLFVFIQADGGWDPTSFCDPKTNTPGEKVINHWAEAGEIGQVGNLSYADFANNAEFFEKYYDRMLVINGVDAQTNSHSAGIVHNLEWPGLGRVSEHDRFARRASWPEDVTCVSQFRWILRYGQSYHIHSLEQCGSASQYRDPEPRPLG